MTSANRYPGFCAPIENGQVFCDPAWPKLIEWTGSENNRSQLDQGLLFGLPISQLSAQARKSTISAVKTYTSQYADASSSADPDGPLIFTGHQPELFHPGVWYKNFSAARLAKASGGTAINLIIDSDLCRAPAIRIPTGSANDPAVEHVAYDKIAASVPYEERQVADQRLWHTFGERSADTIQPLVKAPMVRDWWPTVVSSSSKSKLGIALSQARHRLERAWGSYSWEVPQSMLCQLEAFRLFALHLFVHAERFRQSYNSALSQYRIVHRLRNLAHPVPDLHSEADWIETPFWVWSTAAPVRRPLYVQTHSSECYLSDRHDFAESLPIDSDSESDLASSKLADLESRGIKIRTRALTTTLFVRLFLADVFIHGIGGAKYDQVTDLLCRNFLGIELPPYATVSGTLHLPIPHIAPELASENFLRQEMRDLLYHPESHLEDMRLGPEDKAQIEQLISSKQKWVHTKKTPGNATVRHQEITSSNEQLQVWLANRKKHLEQEIFRSQRQDNISQILNSREYSYCLFPSESLQEFLLK
ncbi:hypothetical protein [Bythopirellula polymerisocia]|uniref:Uncharacterized protein n=1 Tax=Bythopirellula polymerisocia TaxID=2528003 RepID=A0A5C6CTP0_9BACT|nr:hypothetical protein [Bythopirellula polymerisocia]TWU26109.1 hypothetical protein Pla144_33260 [Bythopirellula polymerisocia]